MSVLAHATTKELWLVYALPGVTCTLYPNIGELFCVHGAWSVQISMSMSVISHLRLFDPLTRALFRACICKKVTSRRTGCILLLSLPGLFNIWFPVVEHITTHYNAITSDLALRGRTLRKMGFERHLRHDSYRESYIRILNLLFKYVSELH